MTSASAAEKKLIDSEVVDEHAHYEPYGWHHWPKYPWPSYQFRRSLGETQEGGGTVSESFLAASRMIPGNYDSWHNEWMIVANASMARGEQAEAYGHIQTAMNCYLRAADMYRSAEFWLDPADPRRLPTFGKCEAATHRFMNWTVPKGEIVEIPYEPGVPMTGYFFRSPFGDGKQPVLISFGGLDSFKDELWFMTGRGALQRGISVLLMDGPGQGATLRRYGLVTRYDYEVPVGKCIDWLELRDDVDPGRIAVSGSSFGGYHAARAGCMEPRLAAAISHGGVLSLYDRYKDRAEDHGLAGHMKWVFGADTMKGVAEKTRNFDLRGAFENMKCPYLILHGGHDVLGVEAAKEGYQYAKSVGVDVTFILVEADTTGAEHCQHDNPTLGQELMLDWLADKFGIDQHGLIKT
jgi:pimeloyl-ACP methyl ester carboxylesterase